MSEYLDGIEGYDDASIDEPVAKSFNAAQYVANARPDFYKYTTWYLNPAHIEKAIKVMYKVEDDVDKDVIKLLDAKMKVVNANPSIQRVLELSKIQLECVQYGR